MALGVLEEIDFEDRVACLEAGDQVIFYTDGITEAFSSENRAVGEERLQMTIRVNGDGSAQVMLEAIVDSVAAFVGDQLPSDDITLMVLRRQVI
jgi:sigma-B regulation protein RsbU (phosphoserine phosphatase)